MSHSLPLPKYHQIYLVLREQLHEGRFSQGMPGELALMRQFGVARVTIRRALSQLVDEGLITREPGRGTRPLTPADVTGSPGPGQRAQLSGLLENIISMGLRTSVKVLSVDELDPPGEVALRLDLPSGERVHALPTAAALLRLAPVLFAAGRAVPAEQAMPLYIRDKVAQTTAERMAEREAARGAA